MDLLSLLGLGAVPASLGGLFQEFLYTMFLWAYNLVDTFIIDLPLF